LDHLIFAYLALVVFLVFIALGFIADRKNSLNLAKSSTSYSSRLINAISGTHRMNLEVTFEPEIKESKVKEIKEKLLNISSKQINKSILYLSHQKDLSEKRDKYIEIFLPYFIVLVVVSIYGKESSPLIGAGLGLFFAFVGYQTYRSSMSAKLGFCLRILKEVQAEKDGLQ
jgi:hypothetical protein